MVREGRVLISSASEPDFGSNYYVTAYEVGAQVTSGSSGNTVAVRAGHGFAALDKFIVGTSTAQFKSILSVTSTQLTLDVGQTVTVAAGDLLVNLGQDTGSSTPSYVQSTPGLAVYTDMDYSNVATDNTVQTAELVIMTHLAKEKAMQKALTELKGLSVMKEIGNFVRVES